MEPLTCICSNCDKKFYLREWYPGWNTETKEPKLLSAVVYLTGGCESDPTYSGGEVTCPYCKYEHTFNL